ncbi:MAG: OmpA family protein [Thermodesulfobacteriota bacterium]
MLRFLLCSILALVPVIAHGAAPGFLLKKAGTLSGQVFVDNAPLANAVVAFFLEAKGLPPVHPGMTRVPEALGRLDGDGRFAVRLAPGSYYLGMLQRDPAAGPGPPRPGEAFYFAADPERATLRVFTLARQETLDLGRIDGLPPERLAGVPAPAVFTARGRLLDGQGQPVAGAVVLAKRHLDVPRPDVASARTGADGAFTLALPAETPFFLVARETMAGGRPQPGQLVGTYGIRSETGFFPAMFGGEAGDGQGLSAGTRPQTVAGAAGETRPDLEIVMYPVPDPAAIKASLQGAFTGPASEAAPDLGPIPFAVGGDRLDEGGAAILDRWAGLLSARATTQVEVRGYADDAGAAVANEELARQRARQVADYLAGKGIARERLTVLGVAGGGRRVEIRAKAREEER